MSDHIHILGICGTFMAGLALLARESGFSVTGSDRNIYPPMSTQLLNSDIPLVDGYDAEQLSPAPGCVVVGNALSRGQPVVEAMLNSGIPYTSGPNGSVAIFFRINGCSPSRAPMAKPAPPACWPGFWSRPDFSPGF